MKTNFVKLLHGFPLNARGILLVHNLLVLISKKQTLIDFVSPSKRAVSVSELLFNYTDSQKKNSKLLHWLRLAFGNRNGMMTFHHFSV